jgi:hypothetical protein
MSSNQVGEEPSQKRIKTVPCKQQGSGLDQPVASGGRGEGQSCTQYEQGSTHAPAAEGSAAVSSYQQWTSDVKDLIRLRLVHQQRRDSSGLHTRIAGVSFDGRQVRSGSK